MIENLRSTFDILLDIKPGDLIGAVMIALTLALAMTGLYALRRKKMGEPMIVLIVLMLCANVTSMALAAGYLAKTWRAEMRSPNDSARAALRRPPASPVGPDHPWRHPGGHPGPPPGGPPVSQIFAVADADRNGRLTPEEAALFVRAADSNGTGSVDVGAFYAAVRGHLSSPPAATVPPQLPDPDESR
jgi:hypothetical protein